MKPIPTSKHALLTALAILFSACQKPTPQSAALPFEYTNIVHDVSAFTKFPTPETIITFTNLVWFGHQSDQISMGLGTSDYESTVSFNHSNHTVTKIIQQITVGTNHFWLIDTDGDGVPDERRKFQEKNPEILFKGDWLPARGLGPMREVFIEEKWIPVRFDQGRWRTNEAPSISKRARLSEPAANMPQTFN